MDWTLADIRAKIRKLTGRPSTAQISDADILDHINQYYRNILPLEIQAKEFMVKTYFGLTDGIVKYDIPETVLRVIPPVMLQEDPISAGKLSELAVYTDPGLFETDYPSNDYHEFEGSTTADSDNQSIPEAILIDGRYFYVKPPPETGAHLYAIFYEYMADRPTALASDSDEPADVRWGPLIAYGASVEILKEAGENVEANEIMDLYVYHRQLLARKQILQTVTGTRSVPRF